MPLTPFHLGPALLLGVLLYRWLDLPTLLVGSVIVDLRAALVVFGPLDGPVHGVLTTFAGGSVVAVLIAGAVLALPPLVQSFLDFGRLSDTKAVRPVLAAAILGVYSHVVLDSLLYTDARPFFPIAWNPFLLDGVQYTPVYDGCVIAGVLGLLGFVARYRRAQEIS